MTARIMTAAVANTIASLAERFMNVLLLSGNEAELEPMVAPAAVGWKD